MSKCMEGRKGIASFYLNGGFRSPGNHGGGCGGSGGDDGGGERDDHDGGGAAAIQAPDGSHMALTLIHVAPAPATAPAPAPVGVATLDQTTSVPKKKRGRPCGSGRKQKLANVGEWMRNSAGSAFTPHIIHVSAGEDVAEKILSFAQQKKRALCVLSATGSVSQFTASGGTVTYNDRFDILTLKGAYLPTVTGGPRKRAGGVSISVRNDDGRVIGSTVGGKVIASTLVQVAVASFVYGGGDGSK